MLSTQLVLRKKDQDREMEFILQWKAAEVFCLFFFRRKDDPIYVSQKSLKLFLESVSQGNINRSRTISSKTNAMSGREQWYLAMRWWHGEEKELMNSRRSLRWIEFGG